MRNVIVIFTWLFFLVSCTNKKNFLCEGTWLQDTIFLVGDKRPDSIHLHRYFTFTKGGRIYRDKYTFDSRYKIKGSKFLFLPIQRDTPVTEWKIDLFRKEKIVISYESDKINRIILRKTKPLEVIAYDKVLYSLAELYDLGNPDTLGNGDLFFEFYCRNKEDFFTYDNPYKTEPKIKGTIDRAVGALPKNVTLAKYSQWQGCVMNSYEWETLEYKLIVENYFKTFENRNQLLVKMWITEK